MSFFSNPNCQIETKVYDLNPKKEFLLQDNGVNQTIIREKIAKLNPNFHKIKQKITTKC